MNGGCADTVAGTSGGKLSLLCEGAADGREEGGAEGGDTAPIEV
jgi:hypothetical protein